MGQPEATAEAEAAEGHETEGGEDAVRLRSLELSVVPGLEQLSVWLALSHPLVPALVADQRHQAGAALGRDSRGSAIGNAADRTGAIEFGHRREGRTVRHSTSAICSVLNKREISQRGL